MQKTKGQSKPVNNKKAAIQLTTGFMVMLIIAIVVFLLSLVFLGEFFEQATKMKETLDQQTRRGIEYLLSQDARVAVPFDNMRVKAGEPTNFGVGIRNEVATEPYFRIEIDSSNKYIETVGQDQNEYILSCSGNICSIVDHPSLTGPDTEVIVYRIGRETLEIENHKQDIVTIALTPKKKAPRGHYVFNLKVCSGPNANSVNQCGYDTLYGGSVHKLHLIVK
jgi:hypothetical protein